MCEVQPRSQIATTTTSASDDLTRAVKGSSCQSVAQVCPRLILPRNHYDPGPDLSLPMFGFHPQEWLKGVYGVR